MSWQYSAGKGFITIAGRVNRQYFYERLYGAGNYHRLNTANAQLYRTNQRLEKVNERLTEENKILKAENKDYSLLRKVFGRKQIDDLLEQARTVKGRKRDNTRSR